MVGLDSQYGLVKTMSSSNSVCKSYIMVRCFMDRLSKPSGEVDAEVVDSFKANYCARI